MNSEDLYHRLEAIAATPGKSDKERLVGELLKDDFARRALTLMYDGRITFGVAKKTLDPLESIPAGGVSFDTFEEGWCNSTAMLDRLRARELTGNAAKIELEKTWATLNAPSREILRRILLKDARAGFTEGTINRARPGTVFTFDCMLSHKYEPKRIKDWSRVVAEPKLDGMRALAITNRERGTVGWFTRSGKEIPTMAHRSAELLRLIEPYDGDIVLESELVSASNSFNDTISAARKGEGDATDVIVWCFDLLPVEVFEHDRESAIYLHRRKDLLEVVQGKSEVFRVVPMWRVQSDAEIAARYEEMREKGLEGLMVKLADHRYERKRSYHWLKIKAEETEDLIVTGIFEGEKGTKYEGMLGGAIVDRQGVAVRVGGGWSDAERAEFWADPSKLTGRMIEVLYHEVTPDGSLRHPRKLRFRDDKHSQKEAA